MQGGFFGFPLGVEGGLFRSFSSLGDLVLWLFIT